MYVCSVKNVLVTTRIKSAGQCKWFKHKAQVSLLREKGTSNEACAWHRSEPWKGNGHSQADRDFLDSACGERSVSLARHYPSFDRPQMGSVAFA